MFKFTYQTKYKIFKIIRNFFKKFNIHIFYYKEKNYIKEFNPDTIIDVGVANGTDFLFNTFPNAKYLFVEPNPEFFSFIEKNLLKKYKAKLFKTAAGNEIGKRKIKSLGGISTFLQRSDYKLNKEIEVNISKLDQILKNETLNGINLLKIDTEGFELEVLKGSTETLKKINYLIIELRLENIDTYNPSEIFNFLYSNSFVFFKIMKIRYTKNGISVMDVIFKKIKL